VTAAVGDMETAYTDAVGRAYPDYVEYKSGALGGLTLAQGLYKFGTSVTLATDSILRSSPADTWIFQISGVLDVAANTRVSLANGTRSSNIV